MTIGEKIVKRYIEKNIKLIDSGNWNGFYDAIWLEDDSERLINFAGKITHKLWECDIYPHLEVEKFPSCYLAGTQLTEFEIPKNIKRLDMYSFYNTNLEFIKIPEGITELPFACFQESYNLGWVEIPDSVTTIHEEAFSKDHLFSVTCSHGSYAESWADEQGLQVVYKE